MFRIPILILLTGSLVVSTALPSGAVPELNAEWSGSLALTPVASNGLELMFIASTPTAETVTLTMTVRSYADRVENVALTVKAVRVGGAAEATGHIGEVTQHFRLINVAVPPLKEGYAEIHVIADGQNAAGEYVSDVVALHAEAERGVVTVSPLLPPGPYLAVAVPEDRPSEIPPVHVPNCVPSAPCQAAGALQPFSDDPTPPQTGPGVFSHSTFKVSVCWNYVESDGVVKDQRWARLEVWDDDSTSEDDLLWSGLISQADGCITTGDMTRAECCLQGNQDVYLRFAMENSAVWVDHDGISSMYVYDTGTVTVGSQDIWVWDPQAPATGLIGARQFQYTNNAWDFATNYAGRSVCCQVQVEAPSNDFSTAAYQDAFDTIHIPSGWDGLQNADATMHEYAHFLMDKWYGDYDAYTGSESHGWCVSGKPASYVWEESWANSFGARAGNEVTAPGTDRDDDYLGYPMEAQDCPDGANGDTVEAHVSRTLWDLRDSNNDGEAVSGYTNSGIVDIVDDCDHANFREYFDKAGCSWANRWSSTDFRAAANLNRIYY